ncbi:MAG: hypothetical protein Q4F29_05720 [Lachnospiraceae bacterium]|nr:hypothetical protein [Lachnospiraceae bacterium]
MFTSAKIDWKFFLLTQYFSHDMPVHSREAAGQEQGTTCERIVKLAGIQAVGAAAKIPFTKRNFQRTLSEGMYIKYIPELSAAAVQAE